MSVTMWKFDGTNKDEVTRVMKRWRTDPDQHKINIASPSPAPGPGTSPLPIPTGVNKKELVMKVTTSILLVKAADRKLLHIDPLFDLVDPSATVWCLEIAKDGSIQMQISLSKAMVGTRWGKTLCKEGGILDYWRNNLLAAPKEEEAAASAPTVEGPVRPTVRPACRAPRVLSLLAPVRL